MKEYASTIDFEGRSLTKAGARIKDVVLPYTLSKEDNGEVLRYSGAGAGVLTAPGNLVSGFNVGVLQWGVGAVTFAAASGSISRSTAIATSRQYAFASLFVAMNVGGGAAEYVLGGDVA